MQEGEYNPPRGRKFGSVKLPKSKSKSVKSTEKENLGRHRLTGTAKPKKTKSKSAKSKEKTAAELFNATETVEEFQKRISDYSKEPIDYAPYDLSAESELSIIADDQQSEISSLRRELDSAIKLIHEKNKIIKEKKEKNSVQFRHPLTVCEKQEMDKKVSDLKKDVAEKDKIIADQIAKEVKQLRAWEDYSDEQAKEYFNYKDDPKMQATLTEKIILASTEIQKGVKRLTSLKAQESIPEHLEHRMAPFQGNPVLIMDSKKLETTKEAPPVLKDLWDKMKSDNTKSSLFEIPFNSVSDKDIEEALKNTNIAKDNKKYQKKIKELEEKLEASKNVEEFKDKLLENLSNGNQEDPYKGCDPVNMCHQLTCQRCLHKVCKKALSGKFHPTNLRCSGWERF